MKTLTGAFARDYDVHTYGAKGDGATFDTAAVQRAIDACSAAGGGRVVLDGGVFLVKPIRLKSGVELHLEANARLLGSGDWRDYPNRGDLKHVDSAKLPRGRDAALVSADEAENIAITGRGVIDANGLSFVRRIAGADGTKKWQFERIGGFEQSPPRVVFFTGCRDVTVTDVTMTNQPAGWSYWIHDCDRVVFDRAKILADVRYPNNDGIHVNSSRDVSISNCRIETGDDSIVVRANNRSLKERKACERVTVANCQLRSYANCIRIGWSLDGVIRDCTFSNLTMTDSTVGIQVWLPPRDWNPAGDYGVEPTLVERINFDNIVMDRIHYNPLMVRVFEPAEEGCEAIRDLSFANLTCRSCGWPELIGRPGRPLADFRFANCRFFRSDANDVRAPWEVRKTPAVTNRTVACALADCRGFVFEGCEFRENGTPVAGPDGAASALPPLFGDGIRDDTAAIQARLDTGASCIYLPPPAKEYLVSKTLRIGSDQELRLDRYTRVRLAPKSNCPLVANRDWKNGNRNVAVTGGVWDFDNRSQYPALWLEQHVGKPYATTHALPPAAERPGKDCHGFGMDFRRVDGFALRSVTLRNPTTFGFRGERVSNFTVDDVTFDYVTVNPVRACMDGIHFDGGSHHGRVTNLRGACWDDLLAFNSNDTDHTGAEGEPITDIVVDGIESVGCHSAVRLLSTGGDVRNITIRNIHGTFYRYAVGLTHFFAWTDRPRGRFDNITIADCSVAKCVQPPNCVAKLSPVGLVHIEGRLDIGSVKIENLTRVEDAVPEVPTIDVQPVATIENLVIRDCTQVNRTKTPMTFFRNAGKIKTLVKENIRAEVSLMGGSPFQ